jgi:hypothetical protein
MKYNGTYTIIATTFPYGRKTLIVVKEREGEARSFLFSCCIRKRLTRYFIESSWDRKELWTNLGVLDTRQYIRHLKEIDKLAKWYEI